MAFKAGSLRAAIENSGSILWSILAVIATFVVKDHLRDNCSPSSRYCKINLGSAGVISLPAIVAFRTKHKTFLSLNAAEGGEATMSEKGAGPSEMWEIMQTADDKWNVTIRSVYGTYLSCSQDRETVAMVGQPFEDEAFRFEVSGSRRASFRCSNGMYLASDKQGLLAQAPKEREEDTVWALEPREQGRSFSIRSSHLTFISASRPDKLSTVLQSKTGVESVAFVLDKGLAQGHFTLQSIHGTFITPGQNSVGALRREDRHAMWKLSMGTGGTICLEGAGKGQYLWALEDRESVTMMPLCIEHSLLHPIVLNHGGISGDDDGDFLDAALTSLFGLELIDASHILEGGGERDYREDLQSLNDMRRHRPKLRVGDTVVKSSSSTGVMSEYATAVEGDGGDGGAIKFVLKKTSADTGIGKAVFDRFRRGGASASKNRLQHEGPAVDSLQLDDEMRHLAIDYGLDEILDGLKTLGSSAIGTLDEEAVQEMQEMLDDMKAELIQNSETLGGNFKFLQTMREVKSLLTTSDEAVSEDAE